MGRTRIYKYTEEDIEQARKEAREQQSRHDKEYYYRIGAIDEEGNVLYKYLKEENKRLKEDLEQLQLDFTDLNNYIENKESHINKAVELSNNFITVSELYFDKLQKELEEEETYDIDELKEILNKFGGANNG